MKKIGITTTVPIEILITAGYHVIDLNNLFITSANYSKYIDIAERDGFPKSSCAWIKGIYGACLEHDIKEVVGVMEGDCSNTRSLVEVLKSKGIKVYPFSYPHSHDLFDVESSINDFMKIFNVTLEDVELTRKKLNPIRTLGKKIDLLTFEENKATGFENHLFQIMLSDFDGDPQTLKNLLEEKICEMQKRPKKDTKIRLGYMGVPPMTDDLYSFVEDFGASFVYNEVQREFAFPRVEKAKNIYEQYYDYTYPYNIEYRLQDVRKQIEIRKLDAIIHYTQAFCYRGIDDIIIKKELDIPILTIEGDKFNTLDSRTKLRIEAFVDMLTDLKEARN